MRLNRLLRDYLPRQLHIQVGVIVSILLIVSLGLYARHIAALQAKMGTAALRNQTAVIAKNFADLSTNFLLIEDYASLESMLIKIAELPGLRSLAVCTRDGVVLSQVVHEKHTAPRAMFTPAQLAPPPVPEPLSTMTEDTLVVWHPIIIEQTVLGWVKLDYSLEAIAEAKRRIWRDALIGAVPAIGGGVFLILLFLSPLLRSIRRITSFAKRLGARTGETIAVDPASIEIEQLVTALNQTSFRLFEQDRSLRESSLHLQRLERQNLLILESAGEGILGLDTEGKHAFVNPAAAKLLGYDADELIGRSIHETWHHHDAGTPAALSEASCPILNAFRYQKVWQSDTAVFRRKDGTDFPVECTVTPIMDEAVLTGAVLTFRDISDRKQAEEALRQSEQKYRTLFEESKDVVFIATPEGRFLDINQAGADLFGYSSKEELLRTDTARELYVLASDRERFRRQLEQQGFLKDYELRLKRRDGEQITAMVTATVVRDETGKITVFRGILRDVTAERKLEQQLRHAQKMEAVGQLTGGIAHDFNNILTAITGFGYLLQKKLDPNSPLRVYAEQILGSAERAASLTQSLLAFSRKQISNPKPLRLNDIVLRLKNLLGQLVGEHIELVVDLSADDLSIFADSGQLEQVLMNLATNARDAMPDRGTLTIETRMVTLDASFLQTHGYGKPGPYALLAMSDTGAGMDERTRKRIFEPFFTTKEIGKGTGLGLSIVYGIIKQHNGYINVYSEPGIGTTFKIYLPPITPTPEETREQETEENLRGTETILMAEDDPEVRKLILAVLGDLGYTVIVAVNGEEAVQQFQAHQDDIDLVLLDVVMPIKNGKEVYDEVKKLEPGVKVLFSTGYTANLIHQQGILEQGIHLIMKPIMPKELASKVRAILDGK